MDGAGCAGYHACYAYGECAEAHGLDPWCHRLAEKKFCRILRHSSARMPVVTDVRGWRGVPAPGVSRVV